MPISTLVGALSFSGPLLMSMRRRANRLFHIISRSEAQPSLVPLSCGELWSDMPARDWLPSLHQLRFRVDMSSWLKYLHSWRRRPIYSANYYGFNPLLLGTATRAKHPSDCFRSFTVKNCRERG